MLNSCKGRMLGLLIPIGAETSAGLVQTDVQQDMASLIFLRLSLYGTGISPQPGISGIMAIFAESGITVAAETAGMPKPVAIVTAIRTASICLRCQCAIAPASKVTMPNAPATPSKARRLRFQGASTAAMGALAVTTTL